jgi:multidrug efflux pump
VASVLQKNWITAACNSIGLVLVGGMFVGTLFTLFVVPAMYMLFAAEHKKQPLTE